MAETETITRCLQMLIQAFPREQMSEERTAIYHKALSGIPDTALEDATDLSINSSRYFPTIADLKERAKSTTRNIPAGRVLPDCPTCKGMGWLYDSNYGFGEHTNWRTVLVRCNQCEGSGKVVTTADVRPAMVVA